MYVDVTVQFCVGDWRVSLQNGDAQLFNQFLPELKVTLMSKERSNFWQEIVDGNI